MGQKSTSKTIRGGDQDIGDQLDQGKSDDQGGGNVGGADPFAAFVHALMAAPNPSMAAGEATSPLASGSLLWTYNKGGAFKLEATTGFLKTATGDGGFSLNVNRNGSYELKFAGSNVELEYEAGDHDGAAPVPVPPAGNTVLYATVNGRVVANASAGHNTWDGRGTAANPVVGSDTVFGGVGDFYYGGTAPHAVLPAGNDGNCLIYTAATKSTVAPGSVLVDMQHAIGYGSNAEDNHFVNFDQVRGSLQSNVLIGSAAGSDLKSGGGGSVLISLGGTGYELRPDGTGNVLVSTVGADRILLDATHAWNASFQTTLLGFNPAHGAYIDLTLMNKDKTLMAAIHNDATAYLRLTDDSAGSHLLYSADKFVSSSHDILDMPLVHGLDIATLLANKNLVV